MARRTQYVGELGHIHERSTTLHRLCGNGQQEDVRIYCVALNNGIRIACCELEIEPTDEARQAFSLEDWVGL